MNPDFSELVLEKAIFHRISPHYKREKSNSPILSQKIISFTVENQGKSLFLKDEIIQVISANAVSITFDEKPISLIPVIIKNLFTVLIDAKKDGSISDEQFLENSKSIAHILNDLQDARNSVGILAIIYGSLNTCKVIIIAKLYEEKGLQLNESTENDTINLDIILIEKLIRLHKANLLKIGIFLFDPNDKEGNNEITGWLCDPQNHGPGQTADFYLRKFLGCNYTNDSKKQTKDFFEITKTFIIDYFESPTERVQILEMLSSMLLFGPSLIKPKEFIENYIPTSGKSQLEKIYQMKNIELNGFIKDIDYIKKKAEKIRINFENGITITGISENFSKEVIFNTSGEDETVIVIKSTIKRV